MKLLYQYSNTVKVGAEMRSSNQGKARTTSGKQKGNGEKKATVQQPSTNDPIN